MRNLRHGGQRPWLTIAAAAGALAIEPYGAAVRAYENPDRFSDQVDQGGGGARHFTGSPADGYTCKVCHASQKPVPIAVYGLPDVAYVPGATYRVLVDWPDDLPRVALNLEMTDLVGNALGTWIEPDPASLPAADRCNNPLIDTPTGTKIRQLWAGRTVVTMAECGQHQLTLDWRAPNAIDPVSGAFAPHAWFSGSLVVSNHDAKLSGDGVAEFSRLLMVQASEGVSSTDVRARCSVRAPGASHSAWLSALWFVALWAPILRRSAARRASRNARHR